MRVYLNKNQRTQYFDSLKNNMCLSWNKLAAQVKVDARTLRAWRSGEFTIPKRVLDVFEDKYKLSIPHAAKYIPDFWNNKKAGRKGAISHNQAYGNPGTSIGRKKGGLKAIITNKSRKTSFILEKIIKTPEPSLELAELMGILIGDGGITKYQVTISLNYFKDKEYSYFVRNLFEKLFKTNISLIESKHRSLISVLASGKQFVKFFNDMGLPIGNKINHGLDIPEWIKNDLGFRRACIRGIFDTDGSIYLDKHRKGNVNYESLNIAITSASQALLDSILTIYIEEGFRPTKSSSRSVRLRNAKDIRHFFDIIGSSHEANKQIFSRFYKGGFA